MLRVSDDTAAELITKEIGYRVSKSGTTAAGTAAVRADLAADGLPSRPVGQPRRIRPGPRRPGQLRPAGRRPAPRPGRRASSPKGFRWPGKPARWSTASRAPRSSGGCTPRPAPSTTWPASAGSCTRPGPTPAPIPELAQPIVFSVIVNGPYYGDAQSLIDRMALAMAAYPTCGDPPIDLRRAGAAHDLLLPLPPGVPARQRPPADPGPAPARIRGALPTAHGDTHRTGVAGRDGRGADRAGQRGGRGRASGHHRHGGSPHRGGVPPRRPVGGACSPGAIVSGWSGGCPTIPTLRPRCRRSPTRTGTPPTTPPSPRPRRPCERLSSWPPSWAKLRCGPGFSLADEPALAAWELCAIAPLGALDRQRLLEAPSHSVRLALLAHQASDMSKVLAFRLHGR